MAEATAWLSFAALLFLFMGLGLALDPASYAEAAAQWPALSGGEAADARRLTVRLCRSCGLLFLGVAGWLAAAAAGLPVGLAERLSALRPAPLTRAAAGGAATLCALWMGAIKTADWFRPRGETAAGRAAFWSGWGVVATLLSLGAFLLARAKLL